MMKSYRTTFTLIAIFFAGLLTLWGLERAGVLTDAQRRQREGRMLPELISIPEAGIRKVEIERGTERLVFERRGTGLGRWQMRQPIDAAAEPSRLEVLVRNLKELRKSPDAGTIKGAQDAFGLAPPVAIVRLWGGKGAGSELSEQESPLAILAIGKVIHGNRYVRPEDGGGIEIADAKLLSAVDLAPVEWREHVVMGVPSFQVAMVAIKRPELSIRAERGTRGQWKLTEPVVAPASSVKIENLLAALASLRVLDGANGFVADDVKDLAPFGLAKPSAIVELTTISPGSEPMVLHVGKTVPDHPERVYVRQGGQDDVVAVDAKALAELPATAIALRDQRVADIDPPAVTEIQIQARDRLFSLKKEPAGWVLTSPRAEKADAFKVDALLKQIDSIRTSEFLEMNKVRTPELDPPVMTIKIWQKASAGKGDSSTESELAVDLHIGRHDRLLKTLFAQLDKDSVVLALPDGLIDALPRNEFAFRDHTVLTVNPGQISKLLITRAGRTDELEPAKSGAPNQWQMRRPVDAPGDTRSITQALAVLSNLRAEDLVASSSADAKTYGLDHPLLEVVWESDKTHRLKVGAQVPRAPMYYASLDGEPYIFTLKGETLKPFEAEFRDRLVMSFPLEKAERLVLNWGWPKRSLALHRRSPVPKGQPQWVEVPGADARGIDISGATAIVKALSRLEAVRYAQYDGEIPVGAGLTRPRLEVEVTSGLNQPPHILRIGWSTPPGFVFAATGTDASGPVFMLPAAAWDALIKSGQRFDPLPAEVFAPAH
jgi:Domain of unknown function (DUF4340)